MLMMINDSFNKNVESSQLLNLTTIPSFLFMTVNGLVMLEDPALDHSRFTLLVHIYIRIQITSSLIGCGSYRLQK